MVKVLSVVPILFCVVQCAPKLRVAPIQTPPQLLTLPSNATSIRTDINDSFSCNGRAYGYYADIENDCQIFHVCLPITYQTGQNQTFRWSFICPEETVFNQEILTCTTRDETIDCLESPRYYDVNSHFGEEKNSEEEVGVEEGTAIPEDAPQVLSRRVAFRQ